MKWNVDNYRKETLAGLMKSQAKLNKEERMRKIRVVEDGISYEQKEKGAWTKKKIDDKEVDRIIMELYG